LLFAASAAVTIAWCTSMSAMDGMPMRLLVSFIVLASEALINGNTKLPAYRTEVAYFIIQVVWPPIFLVFIAIIRNRELPPKL
jgi:hypothetical protein